MTDIFEKCNMMGEKKRGCIKKTLISLCPYMH